MVVTRIGAHLEQIIVTLILVTDFDAALHLMVLFVRWYRLRATGGAEVVHAHLECVLVVTLQSGADNVLLLLCVGLQALAEIHLLFGRQVSDFVGHAVIHA